MDWRTPHATAYRLRRILCAAALSVVAATVTTGIVQAQSPALACGLDLKVLVLSADGKETVLPAITETLQFLGTPYKLHIASEQPGAITDSFLKSGCRGSYQGIIQTSASLAYTPDGGATWLSALAPAESQALIAYESEFDVRQVNWYAFPTPDVGLYFSGTADTTTTPLPVTFTAAGRAAFPYLSAAVAPKRGLTSGLFPSRAPGLRIASAWTYLATPVDAATIPLLLDPAGNVLAAVRQHADGREMLTLTFDGNQYLTHTVVLSYGLVNWVTRGVFIGERRVYMSPQVDDVFLANDRWLATTPCGTSTSATGSSIRMTAQDYLAVTAWQELRRLIPATADVRLTMAYNGYGTLKGVYKSDTLTPAAKLLQQPFHWVNHTYTHENLDALAYEAARTEIEKNQLVAKTLKFSLYSPTTLVTPEISGLQNANAMRAAYDAGVRYVVSDTSRAGHQNPFPNVGLPNWQVAGIYMIPRRPNNLFYNVASPADWMGEYNCLYQSYWGRALSYQEILEQESETLLKYMLRGEINPWMFHQPNLVAYDKTHSLLSDLLDMTLAKYAATYNLPVESPAMHEIGRRMQEKEALRTAAVSGFISPAGVVTLTAQGTATVPLTGIAASGAEVYGGQPVVRAAVRAGRATTIRAR